MGDFALPCIVCGKELRNVMPDEGVTNQPSGGTAFSTQGHYGSTAFDPMDWSELEINVCDECLTRAGREQRVLHGRSDVPVVCYDMVVGRTRQTSAPVHWTPDLAPLGRDQVEMEPDEVGNFELYPEVEWYGRQVMHVREHGDDLRKLYEGESNSVGSDAKRGPS